jgi:hypothetical protein
MRQISSVETMPGIAMRRKMAYVYEPGDLCTVAAGHKARRILHAVQITSPEPLPPIEDAL